MNAFAGIFDSTNAFLEAKGIPCGQHKGAVAGPRAVEKFQAETGIRLPGSFSEFFTGFADGFQFYWEQSEDVCGGIAIPSLEEIAEEQKKWKRNVQDFLADPHCLDRCVQPPFRAQAFEVWRRMELWVPFWDESNGDHFCVDSSSGQIVYDQHDWFDGFGSIATTNGILAGRTLEDFLRNWSRFCFASNTSLWWGEFGKFGEIRWEPEYFAEEFYRGA